MERSSFISIFDRIMSMGLAISFFIPLILVLYIYLGSVLYLSVLISFIISLIFWLKNSFKQTFYQDKIIVVYILTIVVLLIQSMEEWKFDFVKTFISLVPTEGTVVLTNKIFLSAFSFFPTSLFLAGGAALYKRYAIGNFMANFLFVWAIVIGSFPYIFPFVNGKGFEYVPGQVFAVASILLGIVGLFALGRKTGAKERNA